MMLSLMNKAFESSLSFPDKITFMTALHHTQSIHSDNGVVVTADKIKDLLSDPSNRLLGLQLLELALQQNPSIYTKAHWKIILSDILKGTGSPILKRHACGVYSLIIPYIVKDPSINKVQQQNFAYKLLCILIHGIKNDCQWLDAACKLLIVCARHFPQTIGKSAEIQEALNDVICKQITQSVSSKTLELIGEIYCELLNCIPNSDPEVYAKSWIHQYKKLFHSMQRISDTFLSFLPDDPYNDYEDDPAEYMFENDEPAADAYQESTKNVRRYVNLCNCLAKMLSFKTKFPVTVPVRNTIRGLLRLFQYKEIAKIKIPTVETQVLCSSLTLMQNGNLLILESLVSNFNLMPYSMLISQILFSALQTSRLPSVSTEPVYQLRLAVWLFLNKWILRHGCMVCTEIVSDAVIIDELLRDIILVDEEESSQSAAKAKKGQISKIGKCNPVQRKVCKAALITIENLIYVAVNLISRKMLKEVFTKVSEIASSLLSSFGSFPFPYDDDSCRKNLYSVLLAITVNSKPDQREPILFTPTVFKRGLQDPSIKVTRICHKALAILRLYIHPKKPKVELRDLGNQNRSSEIPQHPRWTLQGLDPVENVPNVQPEDSNIRIARNFHNPNEGAIEEDEPMEDDIEEAHYSEHMYSDYSEPYKYPEQVSSGQRNGEDILQVINSSECQDDVDSEDEEEEEDEEDRSYGDEEINEEEDIQTENICMPSTSKLQGGSPVHITQETIAINLEEPEYETVKQCAKSESSVECNSKQLNGVRNLVPEEVVPSTSGQCLASENGLDNSEEEELEEEEDDDEEEENESFPGEKRVPEHYAPGPASKKPKLEIDEEMDKPPEEHRATSPPLQLMKDSFCVDITDGTKS